MGTTDQEMWPLVVAERQATVAFLHELSPREWEAPSLCEGWRVRDVAAHLLVDGPLQEVGGLAMTVRLVRWRLDVHRLNAWWVERNRDVAIPTLLDHLDRWTEPGRTSRWLGAPNQLRAVIIHTEDMRRPLRRPRTPSPETRRTVLDAVLTRAGSINVGSKARAAGVRLVATDLDWAGGTGPEVCGPSMDLLLAVAGRPAGLAALHGPGLELLGGRVPAG